MVERLRLIGKAHGGDWKTSRRPQQFDLFSTHRHAQENGGA
jgi:hypothetical protein